MNDLLELLSSPLLKADSLDQLARDNHKAYAEAQPYPHIVIDDFLEPAVLRAVLDEFPGPDIAKEKWGNKDRAKDGYGKQVQFHKLATTDEADMGPVTVKLMQEMNSSPFMRFLQRLTGIPSMIPDPSYRGAGLHQTIAGGFLKVHVDFNTHHITKLDRRCNCLIYLNEDWQEEWGGDLEIWNQDVTERSALVAPIANRCVIFSTVPNSWHGHPRPLKCPENNSRKSLVHFYYSNGRPEHEITTSDSVTFWHDTPDLPG